MVSPYLLRPVRERHAVIDSGDTVAHPEHGAGLATEICLARGVALVDFECGRHTVRLAQLTKLFGEPQQ